MTAVGRQRLGISHPKLQEVLHQDFADCSALAEALSDKDAAVFCLGVYTGAVSDAELHRITVDYTVEFARVLRGRSPEASFSFLSGGARPDRTKLDSFRTLYRRGRECTPRGRSATLYFQSRVRVGAIIVSENDQ